jgi:hypothetical protein
MQHATCSRPPLLASHVACHVARHATWHCGAPSFANSSKSSARPSSRAAPAPTRAARSKITLSAPLTSSTCSPLGSRTSTCAAGRSHAVRADRRGASAQAALRSRVVACCVLQGFARRGARRESSGTRRPRVRCAPPRVGRQQTTYRATCNKACNMQQSTTAHRTGAGWSARLPSEPCRAMHRATCASQAALCRASRNEPKRIAGGIALGTHRRALARRVELVGREQRVLPDGAVARRHERRGRGRARKHEPGLIKQTRTRPNQANTYPA